MAIFAGGFLGWFGVTGNVGAVFSTLTALALEWYLCYWLYKRRIFIRI